MKHLNLSCLLAMLFCMAVNRMYAYDFEVDGICYNVLSEEERTVEVTYGISYEGDIVIPEEVEFDSRTYVVVRIGRETFGGCENLINVNLPNSITEIGINSFCGCCNLASINIPNSVEIINFSAFQGCHSLTTLTIPKSVVYIEWTTFQGCYGLTEITVDSENPVFDSRENCNAIIRTEQNEIVVGCRNTQIPNTVTSIGSAAFYQCFGLKSIDIPLSVKRINHSAFYHSGLESLSLPSSIDYLASESFAYCNQLETIHVSSSVTTIDGRAFVGCTSVTEILVDEGNPVYDSRNSCNAIIHTASNELIVGCKNTIIPNTVRAIGDHAFTSQWNFKALSIPNSVKTIGAYSFYNCYMSAVNIPNSVKIIYHHAFESCYALESVFIPNSVESLGAAAFSKCSNLSEVTSMIQEPFPIDENCWTGVDTDNIPLYVPLGTKELYETTEGWNVFKNIVEMGLEPMDENDVVDFGGNSEITEDTDLDGNIIGNIYYSITSGNGFFDPVEGCIVLNKSTLDELMDTIENVDLFSNEMRNKFTGLVFMLQAGMGTINITAETLGAITLSVKIGDNTPVSLNLSGRQQISLPYYLMKPAYVYIYGGQDTSMLSPSFSTPRRKASAAENALKIYELEWCEEEEPVTGIELYNENSQTGTVYNLSGQRVLSPQRGVYIVNRKKILVK